MLLLLPFGVLITTIFRNLLGVRSYGTFTPTLRALAAVYADWVAAVVLLVIVIALAFTGRTAMPDKLSRIPRLAIMFTFVALSMTLGISLMDYFNLAANEHMVLLPIVILTSLIDRFYSTVDEDGIKLAIRRLIWTVVIGLFCYPALTMESIGGVLLAYPETHFITIAVILLISTYKGKQLSDFPLFSWIKEPVKKEKKTKTKSKEESTSISA